jgi:hypothetical protein
MQCLFVCRCDGTEFCLNLFCGYTRIPLWSTIKLAVAAWLVLPQFRGGIIVYEHYVRPYFYSTVQNADAKLTDSQRKFLSSISPEARNSVAQFIDDNGSDAFDKIMAAVNSQHSPTSFMFVRMPGFASTGGAHLLTCKKVGASNSVRGMGSGIPDKSVFCVMKATAQSRKNRGSS